MRNIFQFCLSMSCLVTIKVATLNLSHQKDWAFKFVTPERQALCSMKGSFTYFCSDFTYYTVGINESYIYMHIFSEAVPLARHPVHFLGLYGSLKLKKTLSTLFHSMSWVLIPSNKGAVPPFFHFTSVLD